MGATPKTSLAGEVAPRNQWPSILRDTAVEVFFMMVGVAVLVPELVVKHWWQTPLHNQRAQVLKLLLLMRGNQRIMVINIPWYL